MPRLPKTRNTKPVTVDTFKRAFVRCIEFMTSDGPVTVKVIGNEDAAAIARNVLADALANTGLKEVK